jgi:hypothetical protein
MLVIPDRRENFGPCGFPFSSFFSNSKLNLCSTLSENYAQAKITFHEMQSVVCIYLYSILSIS